MKLTYTKKRGYHHWLCLVCGVSERERIPDQATEEYQHNPANPILGICGSCNRGSPSARIRLGNSTVRPAPILPEETQMLVFEGVWGEYWEIAKRFEHKARAQDRDDLRHNIIIRLVEVAKAREASGEDFSYLAKLRTASYTCLAYWRDEKRNGKIISLNTTIQDEEGDTIELIDTLADDNAIDLDAWLDARVWLMGCPKKLVQIARKRASGFALTATDHQYLWRYKRKAQMRLAGM